MALNACGFEHNLSEQFTEGDDPYEIDKEYHFSEWYDIIKDAVYTPKSYICSYDDLFNGKIDKIIKTLPGSKCFARLNTLSSKPTSPYYNSTQIIQDLQRSERTKPYFVENMPIIIREYLDLHSFEFRCFVHDKKLRGISTEDHIHISKIKEIVQTINHITFITDYCSYCADFTYCNGRLMLIEINTPVWLFATSGLFSLELPYDLEILIGTYMPDIINYPVVKTENYCN